MELEEAIERCKNIIKHKLENDLSLKENQAIETVLEELNNRIPVKKIKKVLKELDERVLYPDKCNYYARLTIGEALSLKHFIENEILNKE